MCMPLCEIGGNHTEKKNYKKKIRKDTKKWKSTHNEIIWMVVLLLLLVICYRLPSSDYTEKKQQTTRKEQRKKSHTFLHTNWIPISLNVCVYIQLYVLSVRLNRNVCGIFMFFFSFFYLSFSYTLFR